MTRLTQLLVVAALSTSLTAGLAPTASANDTAAFFGGLAAGAFVAGAVAGGRPAPVYSQPYAAQPYYTRQCWFEAQPVFNQFGYQIGTQTVRRCN